MKRVFISIALSLFAFNVSSQVNFSESNGSSFAFNGKEVVSTPSEGVWSVGRGWKNDWVDSWVHGAPTEKKISGDWTVLSGEVKLPEGNMMIRDSYRTLPDGMVRVVRRWEWMGKDTLKRATLSVRLAVKGDELQPFAPGILYYGNPAGAKINSNIIPVYTGKSGEFAIFEDHRYSMPFFMLENSKDRYAVALHTTPSSVRGAVLQDQWWSMGVEARDGFSELVLYSGAIGYNGKRGVAKALQQVPMRYTDTYINMEPGRIIEKEFMVDVYKVDKQGTGFQHPIYTSMNIYKPFYPERFPEYEEIVRSKANFAASRWIDEGDVCGWGMYDFSRTKELVMGWCGQAESLGFAMQYVGKYSNDPKIGDKVQRSLDFLSGFKVDEKGYFPVVYNVESKKFRDGDNVSCGQAMYNFARAIESGRGKYNTKKWEDFLKKAADGQAKRILDDDWKPVSTAEGFFIAPLAKASKLFKNETYKKAALKASETFAARHLSMQEPYWGGTLDATCEDKEGAWAAFQGFLEIYEQWGDKKYLEWAKHSMDVCLSYVVVWDIPLPPGRLADHNFKTTGWTVVSPQNQHIDVFAVVFTPSIYKMGVILKDENLKKLARVMYRSCFQLTDAFGSQGEQLQQTNFAQHGDMSNVHNLRGGYAERWTVFWITAHFLNAAASFEEMKVTP